MEKSIGIPEHRYYLILSKEPPKKPELYDNHLVWYTHITVMQGGKPLLFHMNNGKKMK